LAGPGADKRVDHLTRYDVYDTSAMAKDRAGVAEGATKPVRARTFGEVKLLKTMIPWAMSERLPDGSWLLENTRFAVGSSEGGVARRRSRRSTGFLKNHEGCADLGGHGHPRNVDGIDGRFEIALVLAGVDGGSDLSLLGLKWSDNRF